MVQFADQFHGLGSGAKSEGARAVANRSIDGLNAIDNALQENSQATVESRIQRMGAAPKYGDLLVNEEGNTLPTKFAGAGGTEHFVNERGQTTRHRVDRAHGVLGHSCEAQGCNDNHERVAESAAMISPNYTGGWDATAQAARNVDRFPDLYGEWVGTPEHRARFQYDHGPFPPRKGGDTQFNGTLFATRKVQANERGGGTHPWPDDVPQDKREKWAKSYHHPDADYWEKPNRPVQGTLF